MKKLYFRLSIPDLRSKWVLFSKRKQVFNKYNQHHSFRLSLFSKYNQQKAYMKGEGNTGLIIFYVILALVFILIVISVGSALLPSP